MSDPEFRSGFTGCKAIGTNNDNNNKLWNMKVIIIPIVIDALGTVTKGSVQELEDGWRLSKVQHHCNLPEY